MTSPFQVVVEINKTQTDPSPAQDITGHSKKDDDDSQQDRDQLKKTGTKQKCENLDEIVTVKRDDVEDVVKPHEQFANGGRDEVEECKHKGFSFQRAWCCLRTRRTS